MTNTLKALIENLQIEGEQVELDTSRRGNVIKLELKRMEGEAPVIHYNFGVFNEGSPFAIDRKKSTGFSISFATADGNSCSFEDDVYIRELNGIIKGSGVINSIEEGLQSFIEKELEISFSQ
ncbi:hypothetical protein [Fodinibius halophilus]|uniref:Uncharacterized protein n=1 Tax=Fodinibius halophilus TaxID=1736908 RepID=A0A6M1T7L8_9BACT|nr:hypothetical protein [Fodinibius halophilus]NGP90059.1 hypothetical protein [Fodinibius halophilus]